MGIINKYRKDNKAETLFPALHKQGSLVMLSRLLIISSTTQVKLDQKTSLIYRVERYDRLSNLKIYVRFNIRNKFICSYVLTNDQYIAKEE